MGKGFDLVAEPPRIKLCSVPALVNSSLLMMLTLLIFTRIKKVTIPLLLVKIPCEVPSGGMHILLTRRRSNCVSPFFAVCHHLLGKVWPIDEEKLVYINSILKAWVVLGRDRSVPCKRADIHGGKACRRDKKTELKWLTALPGRGGSWIEWTWQTC